MLQSIEVAQNAFGSLEIVLFKLNIRINFYHKAMTTFVYMKFISLL